MTCQKVDLLEYHHYGIFSMENEFIVNAESFSFFLCANLLYTKWKGRRQVLWQFVRPFYLQILRSR